MNTIRLSSAMTFWFTLLTSFSAVLSLGFACAVPFVAFATFAALYMTLSKALFVIVAVWFINQAIGFVVLGYPWTLDCLAWGIALGTVSALSCLAAARIAAKTKRLPSFLGAILCFIGAFCVYEGGLFLVAHTLLGGTETFTLDILAQIIAINALATIPLFLLKYGIEAGNGKRHAGVKAALHDRTTRPLGMKTQQS